MFFLVIATWIATGLLVGFIASKLVNLRGDDPRLGLLAGAVGGLGAGFLFGFFGETGVTAWSWWGVVFAAAGGAVAVLAWHLVRSRTISRARYVPRSSY